MAGCRQIWAQRKWRWWQTRGWVRKGKWI